MKISILGTGAYGIALANMASKNNCDIIMWTKLKDEYDMLTTERCNKFVFPEYKIDDNIKFTMSMEEVLNNSDLIIISVPVKFIESTVIEIKKFYKHNQHICIASKGIEQESCLFPYDIVKNILNTNRIGVISGGTFAVDMIRNVPMGLIAASKNKLTLNVIKEVLENKLLKIEISKDVLGTEIWGAVKNIIAIGCGIIDGMEYPESTKSMFFTKCYNDVIDLIYDFGGSKKTAITYAGIGDVFLTCTSLKSRNYTFGNLIGIGTAKNVIDNYIKNTTIEGLYTLRAFYDLIKKNNKNSCIIDIMYDIVYKNMDPKKLAHYLMK